MGYIWMEPKNIFKTDKPTYYFDVHDREVSYLEHAEFIAKESKTWTDPDTGIEWKIFPMLDFRDAGTHYAVTLFVTEYQRKPSNLDAWLKMSELVREENKNIEEDTNLMERIVNDICDEWKDDDNRMIFVNHGETLLTMGMNQVEVSRTLEKLHNAMADEYGD